MLKKAILLCAMLFLAGSSPSYAQRQHARPATSMSGLCESDLFLAPVAAKGI